MHKTTINLNTDLVKKIQKLTAAKTVTETIHTALQKYLESIQKKKAAKTLRSLRGSKIWDANLSDLRKSRV